MRPALQHRPRFKGGRNTSARRGAIRRILRGHPVATQEELGRLLALEGFEVTQATLSRDLAQLRARRVSLPEGGTTYELDVDADSAGQDALREIGQLVLSAEDNGYLVVLFTQPGAASTVARAIDLARIPHCLGSVAGDDTVFVAPGRASSARGLARKLRELFGKG
ncbi:MAG TPA: arginine repressor [Myxococcaceae bacterium]|nr:arginine repressor [Myxococcaceae bacterium]